MAPRSKEWRYLCPYPGCTNTYSRAEFARRHATTSHGGLHWGKIERIPKTDMPGMKPADPGALENTKFGGPESLTETEIDPLLDEEGIGEHERSMDATVSSIKELKRPAAEPNPQRGLKFVKLPDSLTDAGPDRYTDRILEKYQDRYSDRYPENESHNQSQLAETVKTQDALIQKLRFMLDRAAKENAMLKDAIRAIRRSVSSYSYLTLNRHNPAYME